MYYRKPIREVNELKCSDDINELVINIWFKHGRRDTDDADPSHEHSRKDMCIVSTNQIDRWYHQVQG